jgi:translocation and assembly module TamB
MIKKYFVLIISLSILSAAILAFVFTFIETEYFKDILKGIVVSRISSGLGCEAEIESLEGNLLTGIRLKKIWVSDKGNRLFFADELTVSYFAPVFLERRISILKLELSRPVIFLSEDADGAWNYEKVFARLTASKQKSKGPLVMPHVGIHRIVIKNGDVLIDRGSVGKSASVTGINLTASLGIAPHNDRFTIRVVMKNMQAVSSRPKLEVTGLKGELWTDGVDASVKNMELKTAGSKLLLSGKINNLKNPVFDLKLDCPGISMKELAEFFPPLQNGKSFSTVIAVSGGLNSLQVIQTLRYEHMRIRNEVVADLGLTSVSMKSEISGFEPGEVLPLLGLGNKVSYPEGKMDLTFRADARGNSPDILASHMEAVVNNSTFSKINIYNARLSADLDKMRISLKGSFGSSLGNADLSLDGAVGGLLKNSEELRADIKLSLSKLDLSVPLNDARFNSDLNLDSQIGVEKEPGRELKECMAHCSVRIKPSTIAGAKLDKSVLRIAFHKKELSIISAALSSDKLGLTAAGTINFSKDPALDLTYAAKKIDLEFISRFLPGVTMGGELDLSGTVAGPLSAPAVTAVCSAENVSYGAVTADQMKLNLGLTKITWPIEGKTGVVIDRLNAGRQSFEKIRLTTLSGAGATRVMLDVDKDKTKKLKIDAAISVSTQNIVNAVVNEFSISMATTTWANSGPIVFEASKNYVRLKSFGMESRGQEISASGPIGRVDNNDFKVNISSLDLSEWTDIAGYGRVFSGKLSASMDIEGNYLSPRMRTDLYVSSLRAGGVMFDAARVALDYREKRLDISADISNRDGPFVVFSADVPIDLSFVPVQNRFLQKGMSATLKSTGIGLGIIPELTNEVRYSTGTLSADLSIRGTPDSPDISGAVSISGGAMSIVSTGMEYRDINGHAVISGSAINIDRFYVKGGDGSAQMSGKIVLKEMQPYETDLNLVCRNFSLMKTKAFSGVIDSDLVFKGPEGDNSLTGKASLLRSAINVAPPGREQVGEIEFVEENAAGAVKEEGPPVKKNLPLFEGAVVDIKLAIPGKTWVTAQGVSAEVEGELEVKKKRNGDMLVSGEIRTVRGTYTINGRVLTITEATIKLAGDNIDNASINAKASGKVSNVSIDVSVTGTVGKPVVAFTSDPVMDTSDIISYLVFGTSSNKLSQSQGESIKGASFDVLAGFTEQGVRELLGKVYSFDVISLQPSQGMAGVGKYVTDKLFVKYDWHSTQDEAPQTTLDYRFNKYLDIVTQIGDPTTSGTNLFIKFTY